MVDLYQKAKAMNVYPAFNRRHVLDFAVATMGSPVASTLIKAVGLGLKIPGLSMETLRRYKPILWQQSKDILTS